MLKRETIIFKKGQMNFNNYKYRQIDPNIESVLKKLQILKKIV